MNHVPFFLASRYIRSTKTNTQLSFMLIICFAGILIGSFSLALVVSIMNGFEQVTHEKLQGVHSHIIMESYGDELNIDQIGPIIDAEFPQIESYSPTTTKHALLDTQGEAETSTLLQLKAIDPEKEANTTVLEKMLNDTDQQNRPHIQLAHVIHGDSVVIGKKLAELFSINRGDSLNLFFTPEEQTKKRKLSFKEKTVHVAGIIATGVEEYDSSIVLCSFELLESMWPDSGPTHLNIKLKNPSHSAQEITALRSRFGLLVYAWQDLYPALVSALTLEKYAMFFILTLIALVASMNIISLQFMHITHKRGDIAILRALGATPQLIIKLFFTIGIMIATVACACGLVLAFLAGTVLQHYPFIELPDVYYTSHLPVTMEFQTFALIFVIVLLISCVATYIPARATRTIKISDVLRFEG